MDASHVFTIIYELKRTCYHLPTGFQPRIAFSGTEPILAIYQTSLYRCTNIWYAGMYQCFGNEEEGEEEEAVEEQRRKDEGRRKKRKW